MKKKICAEKNLWLVASASCAVYLKMDPAKNRPQRKKRTHSSQTNGIRRVGLVFEEEFSVVQSEEKETARQSDQVQWRCSGPRHRLSEEVLQDHEKASKHGQNRLKMEIEQLAVCWKGVLWKFMAKIQIKMENFDVKNGNYEERKALIYIKRVESGNFAQEQV